MAKKTINLGSTPDGKGGDDIRSAFTKTNENFSELYRDKADKEEGKQLSDENYTLDEKQKLNAVQSGATKNRADSANADKKHNHAISDVVELSPRLDGIDSLLSGVESSLNMVRVYILSTPFTPFHLFLGGERGAWYDPSDLSTLFQDSAGTTPVTGDGDPIGLVLNKLGNTSNFKQTLSAVRPAYLNGAISFDKADDALVADIPAGGITGTLFLATTRGTASYGVRIPAGEWTLGSVYNPVGDVVSAVLLNRPLSGGEKSRLHAFGIGKGGTEYGDETIFNNTWRDCTGLTSFPVLDVSSATDFNNAWRVCRGLTSFPANFFDNCLATIFTDAFTATKLSQESIDGILVSINSNATSNGTFNQSGGSAPSAVGKAAIDAMRSRGWTVITTGGY